MENDTVPDLLHQEYEFSIRFLGENHISLDLLSTELTSFNELIHQSVREKYHYEYRVISSKQGSFELDIVGIATVATSMVTPQNIEYIKTSLQTIKEWFEIKKHLNGQKPKKIDPSSDKIIVENSKGDVMIVSNEGARYFENANIQNSIIHFSSGLAQYGRSGFCMSGKDGEPFFNIEKDEYENLSEEIDLENPENKYIQHIETNLLVNKIALVGSSKWEFYFNKAIQAKIEDEEWLENFKKHRFAVTADIQLKVSMRSECSRDKSGNPVENTTKYYIEKVHKIIYPDDFEKRQTTIF